MTVQTDPEARPVVLPRLQRNEAQARTLLAQRAREVAISLHGKAWLLTLEPWVPAAALSLPSQDDWLVHLTWAGAPFELRLPASFCSAILSAEHEGLAWSEWPPAFVGGLLENLLQEVSGHAALAKRGAVQVQAWVQQAAQVAGAGSASRGWPHTLGLTLQSPGTDAVGQVHGSLSTDTLGLMLAAGLAQSRPAATNNLDDDQLPLRLRVEVGVADLPARELAALVPGDTVLLSHNWVTQDAGVWVGWDKMGLRAVWEQDHLRVTHLLNTRGFFMPNETQAAPEGDELHDVQEVPVRLTFDLGERMLTLGELRALQVGQVLEMRRPLSQAVSVRVNGALIGSGELVDIDGQLGVTLVSLSRPGAKSP